MPVAICELDDGESLYCEAGAMSWMSPNLVMETKSKGGLGGFFGRALSGESGFQNYYTAKNGNGRIAFSSAYVGNILAVEITPDKPIIIQKRAFLAATMGVEMEIFFQKKLGTVGHDGHPADQRGQERPLRRGKPVQHGRNRPGQDHGSEHAAVEPGRPDRRAYPVRQQLIPLSAHTISRRSAGYSRRRNRGKKQRSRSSAFRR